MKFILFILLCFPVISLAQNKVEEVQLKSGKTAVLYDNGLWIYKDVAPVESKPILAGNLRTVKQLSSLENSRGHMLLIPSGDTVTLIKRYNNLMWVVNYRGTVGYIKDIFLNNTNNQASSSPLYQPASTIKSSSSQTSSPCGARTKTTGAPCKRLVKGGGYCYQHS